MRSETVKEILAPRKNRYFAIAPYFFQRQGPIERITPTGEKKKLMCLQDSGDE